MNELLVIEERKKIKSCDEGERRAPGRKIAGEKNGEWR